MRRLAVKHRLQRATSQQQLSNLTGNTDLSSLPTKPMTATPTEDDNDGLFVVATGGGAYKFYSKIKAALGVEVMREDEMECLIIGLDFFISQVHGEVVAYSDSSTGPPAAANNNYASGSLIPEPIGSHQTPYLLVNIGSGVSMVKVSGPREFERVGGTSLGGGTLWGLLSLLTGARSFEDMLKMAERGDNTAVDMLVGDIYGQDMGYEKIGLKSTTIASTFGKVYRTKRMVEREAEDYGGMGGFGDSSGMDSEGSANGDQSNDANGGSRGASSHVSFRPEDISKSLLYAIRYDSTYLPCTGITDFCSSNNIGQIAYLHAEKHNCLHIYFGGSFIAGHWQTMATLSYAIKFWSKGTKRAYFLRHEGYLGAVGAFLRRQPVDWSAGRRASFDGLFPLSRGPSKQ
jgi:type II pantothenate kinase